MPMITVKYDDGAVSDEKVVALAKALQTIVIEATGIPEVFVYADSPKIKLDVAPLEVFIEMSAHKVTDREALFTAIKNKLVSWKAETGFAIPITITLTPVDWKFEVGL
jgi:hypothetical protein